MGPIGRWTRGAALVAAVAATAGPALAGEDGSHAALGAGGPAAGGPDESPDLVLRRVEKALEQAPGDLDLRLRRSALLVALGRRDEALREAKEAFEGDPDDPAACVLYAPFLSAGAAVRLYEKALERDPALVPAYRALARLHEEGGRTARAAALMEKCVAVDPSAPNLNYRGWLLEKDGRFAPAEAAYRGALEKDRECALARDNLALLLAGRNAADEALRQALAGVEISPRRSASWVVLGLVRARRREFAPAAEAYERALAVSPEDRTALLGLARAYRSAERFDLAEKALDRAGKADPGATVILVQRGLLEMDRGNLPLAEELLERAAKKDPRDARARYLLGILHDRMDRPDDALREYRRAVSLDREEGIYVLTLAQACERRGDLRGALRAFEKAADLLPDDARPLAGQGAVLQRMRRARDAVARYERAAEKDPEDRAVRMMLGILYADALDDREKADACFEKYLELGGAEEAIRHWYVKKKD